MIKLPLKGKRVAFLATDGFEQIELTMPWLAAKESGAEVDLIGIEEGGIQGMNHDEKADVFPVDKKINEVSASDYDALVLPGGVANPDKLRTCQPAVEFVREFFAQQKPVAAICHGPWMLVEANVVRDRELTSWPSLKTDIENAGGRWLDHECVIDQGLVTSRQPEDLPTFCDKMVEEFATGVPAGQASR